MENTPNSVRNHLFSKGRVGRLRYFLTGLIGSIVFSALVVLGVIALTLAVLYKNPALTFVIGAVGFVVLLAFLILIIATAVKRFHDLGKSEWWVLACLVPFWNTYLTLELLLQSGTQGPNKYGEDPLPNSHNDFLDTVGSNTLAKVILTILLVGLSIWISTASVKYRASRTPVIYPVGQVNDVPTQSLPYSH